MREQKVPAVLNETTGFSIEANHRYARYSIDLSSSASPSDCSTGDILQIGGARAIVLHIESVPAKYRQLLGITALLLGQDAHLPSGDVLRVWAQPAGLPSADPAMLLTAATAPGSPLHNQTDALTHLIQAADIMPAGDQLAADIKDYIDNQRQQIRIITQPGSGLAIGQELSLTGHAGKLKVVSIDRQSIKGIEIATAAPVTSEQVPVRKSILSHLKGE